MTISQIVSSPSSEILFILKSKALIISKAQGTTHLISCLPKQNSVCQIQHFYLSKSILSWKRHNTTGSDENYRCYLETRSLNENIALYKTRSGHKDLTPALDATKPIRSILRGRITSPSLIQGKIRTWGS